MTTRKPWNVVASIRAMCLLVVVLAVPAIVAAQNNDPVATRKYTVALGFQRRGLYDEAAQRWEQFI